MGTTRQFQNAKIRVTVTAAVVRDLQARVQHAQLMHHGHADEDTILRSIVLSDAMRMLDHEPPITTHGMGDVMLLATRLHYIDICEQHGTSLHTVDSRLESGHSGSSLYNFLDIATEESSSVFFRNGDVYRSLLRENPTGPQDIRLPLGEAVEILISRSNDPSRSRSYFSEALQILQELDEESQRASPSQPDGWTIEVL